MREYLGYWERFLYNEVDSSFTDSVFSDNYAANGSGGAIYRVLWIGPFLILLVGIVVLVRFIRRQRTETVAVTTHDHERARELLDSLEREESDGA